MNQTSCQQSIQQEFRDRCRALGLTAWRFDTDGTLIEAPNEDGLIGAWLTSPGLRNRIAKNIQCRPTHATCEPVELFDGCWMLPVTDNNNRWTPTP